MTKMTIMDHNEAVRLQAAEKYLLGELPKEQHAAFEEHYFDCSACAEEMKATVAFMGGSRQVARESVPQTVDEKRLVPAASKAGGWFGWLRPAFAVPVFAALLLFIGYQNGVTIPQLKLASPQTGVGEVAKSFPVLHLDPRGPEAASAKFSVGPQQGFDIDVDITGNSPTGFTCQILDKADNVLIPFQVSAEEAKNTVRFHVPGGSLRPGNYRLVVFAGQAPATKTDDANLTGQKSFTVEFLP
jgi:Putative zinc-finger